MYYLFLITTLIQFANFTADPAPSRLEQLYEKYEQSQITECELENEKVYVVSINAFDAPSFVFSETGERITTCNYSWGQANKLCDALSNCETVYRCKRHVSGKPFVDVYELTNSKN